MPWRAIFLFLALCQTAQAHIKLAFPQARAPALDFYSSVNSNGPCGVPKPAVNEGVRTFLEAGSIVDIEWITAIPHMGGIRIEVLNAVDEPIAIFTNFPDPYNVTQSSKAVELPPNFECVNCAIRLTHQATEYGPDYVFFSCADVNILKAIPDGDSCLDHGKRVGGKCQCDAQYSGSHCQYQEECFNNDDCGVQGVCSKDRIGPKSQCFCPAGRHGLNCQKESTVFRSLSEFDENLYNMREVQDNKIYWRIIHDEIEMVLKYPGQSWAAIGWKPLNYECKHDGLESQLKKVTIQPHLNASNSSSIFENAVTKESNDAGEECAPNEQWTECPETSRDCEASCDWTRYPETVPNCPRQCGAPRCVCKEGYVRMTNDEETCVPFDFCEKEIEPSCPANSTWAKCGTACEPSCSDMYDTAPCPASCEKADCTCADNYVRHNGQCIYWGDCPGLDKHFDQQQQQQEEQQTTEKVLTSNAVDVRIESTTTTTRNHKKLVCAVNETVVECGKACETPCGEVLTRAECHACGQPDCTCLQGYARTLDGNCVYWKECPEKDNMLDHSTGATTPTSRTTPKRELKPKVDGDVCYGDFRFPAGCKECDYKLSWNYMEESDEIEFSLETKLGPNSWTGVGFSSDGTMVGADMLIIKSQDDKLTIHDMTSDGYGAPKIDEQDDVDTIIGTHENGVLRAQFIRRRDTGDDSDKQFASECWKMMFPVAGGKLDNSGNVTVHSVRPLISDRQVCIRSCNEDKKPNAKPTSGKCENEYKYPENCIGDECEYIAQWQYNHAHKEVQFNISSRNLGRWTGIGFSRDGQMANSDIYTGWVYENKAYITDRFAYGRQLPAIDPNDRQDIYNIGGSISDDLQTISFTRKLVTSDTLTDYPLDECFYFMYPIGGGRVIAKKSSDFANPRTPIGYHDLYQPRVSTSKICICDHNGVSLATDKTPTRVRMRRSTDVQQNKKHTGNAMECADMVVGSVVDGRARVKDFYTPSKATPQPDSFFGGSDSLSSSAAFQEDGMTTIVFRRKLTSTDKFDHDITNQPMTLIWAKGVDPDNYQHTTGGPAIKADADFFKSSAFKYHGKNKRGHLVVNLFEDNKVLPTVHGIHMETSTCTGRYVFPEACATDECSYVMSWMSDGTVARFSIQAALKQGQWSALGFSPDGSMAQSDVIVMANQEGDVTVTDQFMPHYGRPVVDEQQDIFDVETIYKNGILTANFSRELFSDDKNDVNLQKCVYLLYTPTAGSLEKSGELLKHEQTPVVSSHKICLNTCSEVGDKIVMTSPETPSVPVDDVTTTTTKQTTTTTTVKSTTPVPKKKTTSSVVYEPTEPVKARYDLRVRILNKEFVPDLTDPQTEYYQSFTKQVTSAVNDLLAKRWKGMQVSKVLEYSKGSVIADLELVSTNAVPRPIEVKSLVEENAIRGTIGQLAIEPSTVKATEMENDFLLQATPMSAYLMRNIIMIAIASIVLILVISFTCCLICKCRSSRRYSSYPVPHPAPYPYGTLNIKKPVGFDNDAYHPRHYSQTTTTSTKPSSQNTPPGERETVPEGVGETTYQEWYSKVGSKSQQHEESAIPPPSRPPSTQPYVSYPNDPSGYYTLGGEHRTSATREQAKYFRY